MFNDSIRAARQKKGMSLSRLARDTGLSSGLLSSVERGKVNPSLATFLKITSVLNIDPGAIFGEKFSNKDICIIKEKDRLNYEYPNSKILYELLNENIRNRKAEFIKITIPVGKSSGDELLVHEGEEYGLVLKGQIRIAVGNEVHVLNKGDSISFLSTIPHQLINAGKTKVEAIWLLMPPRL